MDEETRQMFYAIDEQMRLHVHDLVAELKTVVHTESEALARRLMDRVGSFLHELGAMREWLEALGERQDALDARLERLERGR
jgi:hypothetical protein